MRGLIERETELAPPWAGKILLRFGRNPYGEPIFRIVWGPSATKIVGGFWMDVGRSEYRQTLKYGRDPKWVLERWQPAAQIGTPQSWDSATVSPDGFYSIGPFPSRGRYLHCTTFSTEKGIQGYVPLEPGLVEMAARAVWMGRVARPSEIADAMRAEGESKERDQDASFDAMWDEKQLTREGLSIGAGGAFNKQAEIDDYARRIERSKAFVDGRKFQKGFKQQ